MENCTHQWISNSSSNDKPCVYYKRYPVLKLRYRCSQCIIESCRFCLIETNPLIRYPTKDKGRDAPANAIRRPVQIQIKKWTFIKPFLQDLV